LKLASPLIGIEWLFIVNSCTASSHGAHLNDWDNAAASKMA